MMQYIFLNQSEVIQFVRGDATKFVVNEDKYSLDAEFPHDDAKQIEEHMLLGFTDIDGDTQLYEVRTVNISPFTDVDVVYAEHAAMTELLDEIIEDTRPTNVQAGVATTMALNGSRWSLQSAEQTETKSMRFYFKSRWSALQTIVEKYGCGITFSWTLNDTGVTSRNVIVKQRLGADRGKRFELGKDLQSLNYIYDDSSVYTALYGRGKGESTLAGDETNTPRLTFEDVVWSTDDGDPADKPQGQKFVEDVEATALYGRNGRKRTGVIEFDDCEDAEALLGLTWDALQSINSPTVTIKATVSEMENVWGFSHEAVRLGDDVAIIDRTRAIKAKVSALSRDYINAGNTKLTIGTLIMSIIDVQASLDSRIADAKAAGNAGKTLAAKNPELLNGYIDTTVTRILSTGTNRSTDTDGSEIYTTTDGTKAVKLTGSGILCADSKVGDVWQWRTAITGGGMVADLITTGVLQASLVKILGTTQFYWDSENIYILNPEDNDKQIRIGAYDGTNLGIGFTQDGGATWQNAIGFDGITLQAGSVKQEMLDPDIDFGGSTIYYDTVQPSDASAGDIWYDTSANHAIKRYNGSTWDDITDDALYSALTAAADAEAVADSKIRTYAQATAPTGMVPSDVGDLWIDTDDNNRTYRYNGSAWVETTIDAALIAYTGRNFALDSDHEIRCGDAEVFTGDGTTTIFSLSVVPWKIENVTIDGVPQTAYTASGKVVTFTTAPADGTKIVITFFYFAWTVTATGDGVKTSFFVNATAKYIPAVYVNDVFTTDCAFNPTTQYLIFNTAPAAGAAIRIQFCTDAYYKDFTAARAIRSMSPYMFSIADEAAVATAGKKDKLRVSFYIKRTGIYQTQASGIYAVIWLRYSYISAGQTHTIINPFYLYTSDATFPANGTDTDWVRMEFTYNLGYAPTDYVEIWALYSATGGMLEVKRFKVEAGTDYTEWSAAPEDLSNVVSTHTTQIATQASQIALKASQTDVDTLTGRVTTAEGQITVQAGQIALKVSAGEIASALNLTAQSALISASKINLSGYVTITSLGSGGSTSIDGSRITTGTVAASRIDVNNLYVKHLSGADGTFTGTLSAGYWTFNSEGSFYNTGYQQVQMQVSGGYARYTTWNLSALYGSTSYNETRVYGGKVVLDCASTGQSASARSGYWGSYSYSDVCFVCDQAGSSYDSAAGNLGTTDNRWDILWCDTVHYRTRASDSCRDVKHDILPLPDFGSAIDQLAPVSFKYNDDKTQRTRYGLIYEDTIGLMPDICVETQEGTHTFKGVSYEDLIAVLLGEVKRLRQRVASLETSPEQA
jgi:phage minor structural protein